MVWDIYFSCSFASSILSSKNFLSTPWEIAVHFIFIIIALTALIGCLHWWAIFPIISPRAASFDCWIKRFSFSLCFSISSFTLLCSVWLKSSSCFTFISNDSFNFEIFCSFNLFVYSWISKVMIAPIAAIIRKIIVCSLSLFISFNCSNSFFTSKVTLIPPLISPTLYPCAAWQTKHACSVFKAPINLNSLFFISHQYGIFGFLSNWSKIFFSSSSGALFLFISLLLVIFSLNPSRRLAISDICLVINAGFTQTIVSSFADFIEFGFK